MNLQCLTQNFASLSLRDICWWVWFLDHLWSSHSVIEVRQQAHVAEQENWWASRAKWTWPKVHHSFKCMSIEHNKDGHGSKNQCGVKLSGSKKAGHMNTENEKEREWLLTPLLYRGTADKHIYHAHIRITDIWRFIPGPLLLAGLLVQLHYVTLVLLSASLVKFVSVWRCVCLWVCAGGCVYAAKSYPFFIRVLKNW